MILKKYIIASASVSRSQPGKTGKIFRSRFQYFRRIKNECLPSHVVGAHRARCVNVGPVGAFWVPYGMFQWRQWRRDGVQLEYPVVSGLWDPRTQPERPWSYPLQTSARVQFITGGTTCGRCAKCAPAACSVGNSYLILQKYWNRLLNIFPVFPGCDLDIEAEAIIYFLLIFS